MPTWLSELPFVVLYIVLYLGSTTRGQGIYWLSRLATEKTLATSKCPSPKRAQLAAWLDGDSVARGRHALERWGLPLIPLSYLTVGFQTLVHAAAGVLRINWLRFTLVQIPGSLAWAAIYATIGFAAWEAAIGAAAGSPAGWAVIGIIVVAAATLVVRSIGRRRKAGAAAEAEAVAETAL